LLNLSIHAISYTPGTEVAFFICLFHNLRYLDVEVDNEWTSAHWDLVVCCCPCLESVKLQCDDDDMLFDMNVLPETLKQLDAQVKLNPAALHQLPFCSQVRELKCSYSCRYRYGFLFMETLTEIVRVFNA